MVGKEIRKGDGVGKSNMFNEEEVEKKEEKNNVEGEGEKNDEITNKLD
jgi:hypothetical protein